MRKAAGRGKDGRIRVWFNGELCLLSTLAKAERVSTGVALATWHRDGAPDTIDAAFFEGIRSRQYDPNRAKYYSVDGVRCSAKQMVEEFGVNQSTLDNRRKASGKVDYTSAELAEMVERKAARASKVGRGWGRGPTDPPPPPIDAEWTMEQRAMARMGL